MHCAFRVRKIKKGTAYMCGTLSFLSPDRRKASLSPDGEPRPAGVQNFSVGTPLCLIFLRQFADGSSAHHASIHGWLITHQFTEGSSHVSPRMAHHASIQGRLITRQSPDGSSLLRSAGMKTLSPCGCRASWASFTASSQNMRWESISSFPLLSTRS